MKKNPKLPPCPICKTKKYRKNATGNYVCKYGHQLANYQEEEAEDGADRGGLREIRQKKKQKLVKESMRLAGPRAIFVYHQMFQQCLRQLTRVMITKFSAPEDLEIVVREIWLLYVSHSTIHYQYRREMNHSQASMQTSVPDEELELLDDENVEDEVDNDVESKARLVKEETVQSFESAMASISDLKNFNRWPTLHLQRWAVVGKIPYVKVTKDLPTDILDVISTSKLHFVKAIPNMPTLYFYTRRWMGCFRKQCELKFPDSNYVPLVHRGVREMMLPIESYKLAIHILNKLGPCEAAAVEVCYQRAPEMYLILRCPIDVKILAIVVFLAKFYYKLNDSLSIPLSEAEQYIPPKEVWLKALKANIHRWESNLLNGGRRLPQEDDPDEENLREMADMYKRHINPTLYSKPYKRFKDTALLKLLRQYMKELERQKKHNTMEGPGPLRKRKRSSHWDEGSTFTVIRDPYVRSSAADIKELYNFRLEPPATVQQTNGLTRRSSKPSTTMTDSQDTVNFDSESEPDSNTDADRKSSSHTLSQTDETEGSTTSNAQSPEPGGTNYFRETKLGRNFAVQDQFLDINYSEYETVAEYASKLVGLTKMDMIKVELSLETYLAYKFTDRQAARRKRNKKVNAMCS
ncbi:hypothetical protein Unana1_03463 [Umbelopsis nana]